MDLKKNKQKTREEPPHPKAVFIKVVFQGAFPSGIHCFPTMCSLPRELPSELFFFSAAEIMVEGDLILTGSYF